jgi:pimeloyl-ACP methyl ester carboxylesterase
MSTEVPAPYPLRDVVMPSWLIRYDRRGDCRSPLTRQAFLDHLRAGDFTDIVAFSHGWNNAFGDAATLYAEFLRRFERLVADRRPDRAFRPLFMGVVWPSTWLDFSRGPRIAGGVGETASIVDAVMEMSELTERAQGEESAKRLRSLLGKDRLSADEEEELASLLTPVFGGREDEETGDPARETRSEDILAMLREQEFAERTGGAPPESDGWGGIGEGGRPGAPQPAGGVGGLDPRIAIRAFSVYQMKDRAGAVGYHGVASLLREVLASAPGARVHVAGHSYGCKVMLSAVCEPSPLPRPLSSLLLLQPAVSHLCFADVVPGRTGPGGYRSALEVDRLLRPILTTYSGRDVPLHATFHLVLRRGADLGEARIAAVLPTTAGPPPNRYAALGGYGPRNAGEKLVDPFPSAGEDYPWLDDAPIVGLDGSGGRIMGHGDVANDATAWALRQLVFRHT